ncbi:RnfABCDGE type electron transport complex subunit A [Pseudodesulfovibrio thermohalotolerans]|jgi:electron transport complex protein RnfA|uniref:electron transport complex protein RnfA n=1 Tax=Pseudodesulfovibrio thermohalotolerans TaxID=2880651 RepID=UPI0024425789|nr:RnfABCDGE type electron transport complex subunit A [Pseudodesulfovibrio thermohalotolerans]WFS63945.1 RnfABCDGE type electron transport complex subunit A [Pseudodesulfovibrio thermohalotolerans]
MEYFMLFISAIFINNIVLVQYLGTCPFMGTSKSTDVAFGMGAAVIFVMLMATAFTWPLQRYVLTPFGIGYLQTIVFILVIASLVQFVEMFLKKAVPPLHASLGLFLPLITTNCAVMGVAIMVQRNQYSFVKAMAFSLASGIGFLIALIIVSAIRERLDLSPVPVVFRGIPVALVTAGVMSLVFLAFQGMAA